VAFIRHWVVIRAGTIDELSAGLVRVRLRLGALPDGLLADLAGWGENVERINEREVSLTLPDEEHLPDLNAWLVGQGVPVYAMAPQQLSLEQLFVQIMDGEQREGDAA